MKHRTLKIGNAQGFWGDTPLGPAQLVQQQPDLDYLTLDYLAEVSLSILAIQKEKDPSKGYAADFLEVVRTLIPILKGGSKLKIVCNAGGLNPVGCAEACRALLAQGGCQEISVKEVVGDDVLDELRAHPSNPQFKNLDTGASLEAVIDKLVTANAYLGALPIVEALLQGADIVITGRVADPSLTVGPCMAHFGWKATEYDKIAQATVAGHLIECGTQVTGGMSTDWLAIPHPEKIGFPIVEIDEDGTFVITKPVGTGGRVDERTVKEQLLYEIGDPDHYLSPDVTVAFTTLVLEHAGPDRIKISGAKGTPPPTTLKVSATYRAGYRAEGWLVVFGPDAELKAQRSGEIILERVKTAGYVLENSHIEYFGSGGSVPGLFPKKQLLECVLRIAVRDSRREAVEAFSKEIAPLITSGPQGLSGYLTGRLHVRPVFGYWPTLIDFHSPYRLSSKIAIKD